MQTEEAFDFLVEHLAGLSPETNFTGQRRGIRDADLYLPDLARSYWTPKLQSERIFIPGIDVIPQERILPLYDAAWELCRLGVLRPGQFAPMGMGQPTSFGDHYVITKFGSEWLKQASQRQFLDPSRLGATLAAFSARFGEGYAQRATEAVKTYRNASWLAACVMAGAAAESILLAVAIAKSGDEGKILSIYNGRNGRSQTTKAVTEGSSPSIKSQLESALQVLHYWRDDASHGVATAIGEIEAHNSLTQLLRLAQFAKKNWNALTRQ